MQCPCLDPANYSPDAVSAAADVPVAKLPSGLLPVRLAVAFAQDDVATARDVLARMDTESCVGYERFQRETARLWLAMHAQDAPAVRRAMQLWLDGRDAYPANWDDAVLEHDALIPWTGVITPLLRTRRATQVPVITDAARARLGDERRLVRHAVRDNLQWLRDIGGTASERRLAAHYRLFDVNPERGEATFVADALPSLIVTFGEAGQYLGSFIAH